MAPNESLNLNSGILKNNALGKSNDFNPFNIGTQPPMIMELSIKK
jgi:hypothetical protein